MKDHIIYLCQSILNVNIAVNSVTHFVTLSVCVFFEYGKDQIKGFLFNDSCVFPFFMLNHPYFIFSVDMGQCSRPPFIGTWRLTHTHAQWPCLSSLGKAWGRQRERHRPKERPLGHANANMFPHRCPTSALITSSSWLPWAN